MERYILGLMIVLVMFANVFGQESKYPLIYHETFENGTDNWEPLFSQNWRIIKQGEATVYELIKVGKGDKIRKPRNMSILAPVVVGSFELNVEAQCYTAPATKNRDICLFFGYQDSVHFYYTHFSGNSDQNHNAIHIVNNSDRQKINVEPAGESKALLKEKDWYTLTVKRDVTTGSINAFVNGEQVLSAIDSTFKEGNIGIGSFDDTGAFRDVKLWGEF